uniref:Calcium-binding and coiled-coil domain-containing protein 1-like n=1 Tax=Nicotiana sylvestris TaxID=4096 RepID=A0A1U7VD40_NICSY|nr:PREDICTED: calcium-binding and coiled-coil domain-containing protein 1-like [Nicotiana sylvestris]
MDTVEAPCLFNEAQQALNRASVLHNETFLQYREKLIQHEASVLHNETFLQYREKLIQHEVKVWELTEKRDTYKLLNEKLQTELEAVWKEHAEWVEQVRQVLEDINGDLETVANSPNVQVQKRLEQIGQLQAEVDTVKTEAKEWKKNMDLLASEKETVQAQLASIEAQLRAAEKKASTQTKTVEEIRSRLSSAVSSQENLAEELEVARLEIAEVNVKANEKVAQHKVDAEAAQDQAKYLVEHMKWKSRREALAGVQAQGFNLLAEIVNAKISEAKARKLAYPEEEDS